MVYLEDIPGLQNLRIHPFTMKMEKKRLSSGARMN